MNETSRMSCSRAAHGSRPSTLSSPWYAVSPRIAFSKVVLPAPFGPDQQIARARFHEHSQSTPSFDQFFADQLLISLQDRQRIDPILGRDIAHRRQRIAFLEHAVENHVNDAIAKLAINRLTIIPFTAHPILRGLSRASSDLRF